MFQQYDCVEMMALGRQFFIGTLYNYVEDNIIPNIRMWDSDAVSRSIIVRTKQKRTANVLKNLIGHKHRLSQSTLEYDDHSAMSLTAGIIPEVEGAWQYIIDQTNGKLGSFNSTDSEVTVYCCCSGKKVSVDPTRQLDIICGQENLIKSQATHVVVAVTYGLEAFCVFPHPHALNNLIDDDIEHITDEILDCAQNFATCLLDERKQLKPYRNEEYSKYNLLSKNLQCVLYSDLLDVQKNETHFTYLPIMEQYEACKKLMQHQPSESVPLKILLCPLDKFFGVDVTPPISKTDVTRDLVVRYQTLRELWRKILIEMNSLIVELDTENDNDWIPSTLKNKITVAEKCTKQFQSNLVNTLSEWVIAVRGGDRLKQEHAAQKINMFEKESPTFANEVNKWLRRQRQIIKMMNLFTQFPKVCLACEAEKLDQILRSRSDILFVVVLHVPSLSEHSDNFLNGIKRLIDSFSPSQLSDCSVKSSVNFRQLFAFGKQFSEWVTEYNNDSKIVDYVIFYDEQMDASKTSPFIQVYQKGTAKVVYKNFTVPESPGKVTVAKNRRGVITLTWSREEENDYTFMLQYRKAECDEFEPWTSIEHATNSITISYLQSGQTYVFRAAVVTLGGRGPFGPNSELITIDPVCSAPNALQIQRVTDSSIDITWDHLDNIYRDANDDLEISYYSVECWEDGSLEESTLVQRTTTNKSISLEPLALNTTYCVRIRAVCTDSTGSVFYSPTSPILKERTLQEVERAALVVQRVSKKCSVDCGIDTYQLRLKKQPKENRSPEVKRYVFGKPSHLALTGKCRQRTVLMLGATGSGKTTLINAMVNYILGVEWNDPFRFKLIDEQTKRSQAYSQTDFVTTYDLYQMKGSRLDYSLTVVDTPGFGDTRGLEKDKIIMEQIQDYFKSNHGIQQLEAVCFVVQSALPRLTVTQKYIFDSILSIFGQDIKDNIRLMVTFADNALPPVLEAIKEGGIPSPVDPQTGFALHHKFNNSIFFTSNQDDRETNEINQIYFDIAAEGFDQFFDDLSRMEHKSLTLTREVLEERKQLEALVEGIQIRTQIRLTRVDELEKIKSKLAENRDQIKANNNFEFEVNFLTPKSVDISRTGQFTSNCQNCKMTCHFPCRQASDENKIYCSVMNPISGKCRICKCLWSNHYNQKYRYEMVMEKVKRSSDAIRQHYQTAKEETLTNEELLSEMEKDLEDQEQQLEDMKEAAYPHIKRLDEIALRPHPSSTPDYIDLMITAEKREHRKGYQQRIANLQKFHQMAEITGELIRDKPSPSGHFTNIIPSIILRSIRKIKRKRARFRIRPSVCYKPFQFFIRTFGLPAALFIMSCFFVIAYHNPPFILWCTATMWSTRSLLHRTRSLIRNLVGRITNQNFGVKRMFQFLTDHLGIIWTTLLTVTTLSIFSLLIFLYKKETVILSIATFLFKRYSRGFFERIVTKLVQYKNLMTLNFYRKSVGAVIGLALLHMVYYKYQTIFLITIFVNFVSLVIELLC